MQAAGIHAHPTKKLGKAPPKHDVRTLHLANYLTRAQLPPIPTARDWFDKLPDDLGMYANDQYGDCGPVGLAHAKQTWTSQRGTTVNPELTTVLDWYTQITAAQNGGHGFDPNDPSTDTGVVLLDMLVWARKAGLIGGFVKVDHHNLLNVRVASDLFGGVLTGAALPISAQDTSKPWTGFKGWLGGDDAPGSWGGHCMWRGQYTPAGGTFATWGARQFADDLWFLSYIDECYALLSADWVDDAAIAPSGFDLATLKADLALL